MFSPDPEGTWAEDLPEGPQLLHRDPMYGPWSSSKSRLKLTRWLFSS